MKQIALADRHDMKAALVARRLQRERLDRALALLMAGQANDMGQEE